MLMAMFLTTAWDIGIAAGIGLLDNGSETWVLLDMGPEFRFLISKFPMGVQFGT